MEIGPVSAVRPVSLGRPSPPGSEVNPDLNGVFAVELRDEQQPDDSYSPSHEAFRGLEDEEEGEPETGSASADAGEAAEGSINFFA